MLARATLAILVTGIIILGLTPTIMMTAHNATAQTTSTTTTSSTGTVTIPLVPASSSHNILFV
jgi:hypothetical protein